MKILLATEEMTARPCEGLLVFAMHLARFLNDFGDLTVVHAYGEPEKTLRALKVLAPKWILTKAFFQLTRKERFDIAIYIPSSGITTFGLGRGVLIRSLVKTPTILIALQERRIGRGHAVLSYFRNPELILSPVRGLHGKLEEIGLQSSFVMPGYDDELFRPVSTEMKYRLREKYNLPKDQYILLHVGHIIESRNMQVFLRHREWGHDIQSVVKGGNIDPSWRHRLRMAGIIVIDEYIDNIHEIYQAADCYFFPVFSPKGALEFPLSVIEASACDLPVLTTPFGALPDIIAEGEGLLYFNKVSDIPEKLFFLRGLRPQTSQKVKELSWRMVFQKYLTPHLESLGEGETGID